MKVVALRKISSPQPDLVGVISSYTPRISVTWSKWTLVNETTLVVEERKGRERRRRKYNDRNKNVGIHKAVLESGPGQHIDSRQINMGILLFVVVYRVCLPDFLLPLLLFV